MPALYELLQNEKITPLSDTLSLTIRTAVRKSSYSNKVQPLKIILSVCFSAAFIAGMYLVFVGLLKKVVLSKIVEETNYARSELSIKKAHEKAAIGLLQYQSENGAKPLQINELADNKILSKRDMKWLNSE